MNSVKLAWNDEILLAELAARAADENMYHSMFVVQWTIFYDYWYIRVRSVIFQNNMCDIKQYTLLSWLWEIICFITMVSSYCKFLIIDFLVSIFAAVRYLYIHKWLQNSGIFWRAIIDKEVVENIYKLWYLCTLKGPAVA